MKKRGGYEQSARFYDLFDQKKNIEFYLHHAITRGEILDVGAGTGRIAVALARHGIEVYCVEPSPAMRREFRYKLKKESRLQKLITLVPGSAADFRCPRSYRICIMSGVFDHLLNHEERRASLNNIAHHLSEDGVLIFDVHLGLMGNAPLQSAGESLWQGKIVHRFVGGTVLPGNIKSTHLIFEVYEDGHLSERIEEESLVGTTGRAETHLLLAETGYDISNEWGDYDFSTYQEGDPLLIVKATKKSVI